MTAGVVRTPSASGIQSGTSSRCGRKPAAAATAASSPAAPISNGTHNAAAWQFPHLRAEELADSEWNQIQRFQANATAASPASMTATRTRRLITREDARGPGNAGPP